MNMKHSAPLEKTEKMSTSRKITLALNLFTIVMGSASIAISLAAIHKSNAITSQIIASTTYRN